MIYFFIFIALFFKFNMVCMYLVKDYRNGIIYKGFIGKFQNLIKH